MPTNMGRSDCVNAAASIRDRGAELKLGGDDGDLTFTRQSEKPRTKLVNTFLNC